MHKTRYSAFFNSQLDSVLRSRGIRNIVFVGIATNVCVESTLRDGFHLEYFGVMLEDATHHLGPPTMQEATVYNVEKFFGWVSTVADFCGSVRPDRPRSNPMPFEPINPPQFPTPIAPYSAGAKAGNTVYVSGVLALGEGGAVLHVGDAAAQTRHVLDVIKITLEAGGATLEDVAMNHIFLKDLADYAAFNAVYAEYFPGAKPARYCIKCDLVKPDCLVEIAERRAYRLMPDAAGLYYEVHGPAGRAAADPVVGSGRIGELLGAQPRRAGRAFPRHPLRSSRHRAQRPRRAGVHDRGRDDGGGCRRA